MFDEPPLRQSVFASEKNSIAAIIMELVNLDYTLSEAKDWVRYLCGNRVVHMNDVNSLTQIVIKAKRNNVTLAQLIAAVDEVMLDNNSNNKQ